MIRTALAAINSTPEATASTAAVRSQEDKLSAYQREFDAAEGKPRARKMPASPSFSS